MIPATQADHAAIRHFLTAHIETSMFTLANLQNHGMEGGHPRALRLWLRRQHGEITDVMAVTEEGMAMPQLPGGAVAAAAGVLAGARLIGILGAAAQVAPLRAALGLGQTPASLSRDEPLFSLPLPALRMPDASGVRLIPLSQAPRDLVTGWRAAYGHEVLGQNPATAAVQAARDIDGYVAADSHRVLLRGDTPVAMTGFNARLPDTVQIGGVYTPPALRGQGLARLALALHLAEARAQGVTRAILFAASDMAARAYVALGFVRHGTFNLTLFTPPATVATVAKKGP